MSNVLAFSCAHAPAMLSGFPDFLNDTRKAWKCKTVISLGDMIDYRCLGRWDSAADPDLPSMNAEYDEAKRQIGILHKMFPNIDVLIGNHDTRRNTAAKTAGLIKQELRSMKETWATPRWRLRSRRRKQKKIEPQIHVDAVPDGTGPQHDRGNGQARSDTQ